MYRERHVYIYIYTMMYVKSVLPNCCAVVVRRGCAGGLCGGLCGILGVVQGVGRGASNPVQLEAPTCENK